MDRLRLAVDIKSLALHQTGIAVYLANLLALLATPLPDVEITLLGPRAGFEGLPDADRFRCVEVDLPRGPARIARYDQMSVPRAVARSGVDALFSPNCDAPIASPRPVMLTIHDLAYLRFPAAYPWSIRTYYGRLARWHLRRAAVVLTDSTFSADELTAREPGVRTRLAIVPAALDRVFVEAFDGAAGTGADATAADAVDLDAWRAAQGLPARYFVYTGGFDERKDIEGVVRGVAAWAARRGSREPVTLAITGVGRVGDRAARLADIAGPRVDLRVLPPLPRRDMPRLYRAAHALIYLSRYEGFRCRCWKRWRSGCRWWHHRWDFSRRATRRASRSCETLRRMPWRTRSIARSRPPAPMPPRPPPRGSASRAECTSRCGRRLPPPARGCGRRYVPELND